MTTTVSARLTAEEIELIQELADLEGSERSTLIKALLRQGIKDLRLKRAAEAFRREEISVSKAAELAGVPLWDFLALMDREKLEFHYDVAEFEADLQTMAAGR
jgi:predicted HTH domain antitoxin